MTLESFRKAEEIVKAIDILDEKISQLESVMSEDTRWWRLEVRKSTTYSSTEIAHFGMLPDFLNAIHEKYLQKREKLMAKLAML